MNRFSNVDPRHVCGLCHGVANPVGTRQCFTGRHLFCKSCLAQWQVDNSTCPVQNCSSLIYFVDTDGTKVNSHVSSCMVEILLKLEVKCSSRGCSLMMTIAQVPGHEAQCPFKNPDVMAFIASNLDRIKTLETLLHQSRVKNLLVDKKLSETTEKVVEMTKEHELEKTSLIKARDTAVTGLRDEIKELRASLELAVETPTKRKTTSSTPTSATKRFVWRHHVRRVGEPGSFLDNSLAKAKGHRFKCRYCDEDQFSDMLTSHIIRHLRNNHGRRIPAIEILDDPDYSNNH